MLTAEMVADLDINDKGLPVEKLVEAARGSDTKPTLPTLLFGDAGSAFQAFIQLAQHHPSELGVNDEFAEVAVNGPVPFIMTAAKEETEYYVELAIARAWIVLGLLESPVKMQEEAERLGI